MQMKKQVLRSFDFSFRLDSTVSFARGPRMYVSFVYLGTWEWKTHTQLAKVTIRLEYLNGVDKPMHSKKNGHFLIIAAAFSSWTLTPWISLSCILKRRSLLKSFIQLLKAFIHLFEAFTHFSLHFLNRSSIFFFISSNRLSIFFFTSQLRYVASFKM